MLLPTAWLGTIRQLISLTRNGPIRQLIDLYNEYGSIPRAVFGLITTYIVSSVFGFGQFIVGSVLSVFDYVTLSLAWVQAQLGASFGLVGFDILAAFRWVQIQIGSAAAAAGPAAPIIAIVFGAATVTVLYRAGVAILGELPVGSSLVDFLGLR